MSQKRNRGDEGQAYHLLFVCTGNTCRSPMAEAIARRKIEELGWAHVEVRSAGTGAMPGVPASAGAVLAAERRGLELGDHESRPLDREMVGWADLILVMSDHHELRAEELGGGDRTSTLRAFATGGRETGGIADPVGGDDALYEATYRELEELVERALARIETVVAP